MNNKGTDQTEKIAVPLFAAYASPNNSTAFYTNFFLILISPVPQYSFSEVEFYCINLTVFFMNLTM